MFQTFDRISDRSINSDEIRRSITDFQTTLFFSKSRLNFLSPFDLGTTQRVLVLDNNTSIITRYLGELGHTVDSVSTSYETCLNTAKWCEDLKDVTIFYSQLDQLEIVPEKYDYILVNGFDSDFLEQFFSTPLPEGEVGFLNQLYHYLKTDGKILLTADNKLGIKYFSGFPKSESKNLFDSLIGSPSHSSQRNFGKKDLDRFITEADFKQYQYFYPFPDYRLANNILSDDFIHNPGAQHLIGAPQGEEREVYTLPESLFAETLIQQGIFDQFANSYLIVLSKENPLDWDFDFIHYGSSHRKTCYQTITKKLKGVDRVEKEQVFPQHQPLNEQSPLCTFHLSNEPFHHGNLLYTELLKAALTPTDLSPFWELLRKYYDHLCEQQKTLKGRTLDLIFQNIIITEQGFQGFDLEWEAGDELIKKELLCSFVLFRALFHWSLSNAPYLKSFHCKYQIETVSDFIYHAYKNLHLSISEDQFNNFVKIESTLQTYIQEGVPLERFFSVHQTVIHTSLTALNHVSQHRFLLDSFNTLTGENNALKNENNALKNENNALKNENNALKNENNALKNENNALKNENNALKNEIDLLKNDVNNLNLTLNHIYSLKGWKIIKKGYQLKSKLFNS